MIVGTGLGHVNKELYPAIERATKEGVVMYMTLQTIWGYVHMFVYDTGRDMVAKGIVPAGNMLPEVAFIKLGWALGQTEDPEEIRNIMLNPINDEITKREQQFLKSCERCIAHNKIHDSGRDDQVPGLHDLWCAGNACQRHQGEMPQTWVACRASC